MSQESAIWPQGMPPEKSALLLKLFTILDDSSDDSGQRLADQVFTSDGRIKNGTHVFSGTVEIAGSRKRAWDAWSTRKHSVLRVYSRSQEAADDILFLGSLAATFPNGRSATGEFCARIIFGFSEAQETRIKSFEVWADATPFVTATMKD
ncbi:hypothetical protein V8E51_010766 [Hyaloscypha variabilis]|uniref:SnoaL-like domain-containing protein n=1 Tax=Hyaloscypha variabilis (strain UAMH 11265 / GT02V1 / F) TaxID=1149755 RepID=A0A2J6SB08_HYAVF|nr:hypothetical protein L207DRAFT_628488 [Hyaloscypha variabilis F]